MKSMAHKPRIIIAGQIPPPVGGQAVMIQKLISGLRQDGRGKVEHLVFEFTKTFSAARRVAAGKILELLKVIGRILLLRSRGPIDMVIFAPGGPQTVPLIRDLILLPWILLSAKKVMLHFHAGGICDLLQKKSSRLAGMAAWLYGRADSAVVMNKFSLRDPHACGIREVAVIPHRLQDNYEVDLAAQIAKKLNLLYVGNLHDDKGTSTLLKAFKLLIKCYPDAKLELAGEFHPPYDQNIFDMEVTELNVADHVKWIGKISGDVKSRAFAKAALLVFPTVAPSESFGLVMVEGMMWGLPVLASDWRGNRDVLEGSAGGLLFHPAHSFEALGEALLTFAGSRDQWAEMGRANRELFLSKYCMDGTVKELEDFIFTRAAGES